MFFRTTIRKPFTMLAHRKELSQKNSPKSKHEGLIGALEGNCRKCKGFISPRYLPVKGGLGKRGRHGCQKRQTWEATDLSLDAG